MSRIYEGESMPGFGSRGFTAEERVEREAEKRIKYVKNIDNFMRYFVLSYSKLQKLTRKEKMIAIEEHEVVQDGMSMGKLWDMSKEDFYSASFKEKFKAFLILPFVYTVVTLSNRNFKKFKNDNLELYI